MKEFKMHSVETVSEISQKSNEHRDFCKTKKRDQNVKPIEKHSRTSPDIQFKKF